MLIIGIILLLLSIPLGMICCVVDDKYLDCFTYPYFCFILTGCLLCFLSLLLRYSYQH